MFYLILIVTICISVWGYLKFKLGFFDQEAQEEWDILNEYIDLSDEELDRKSAEIRKKTNQALDLLKLATVGDQKLSFELGHSPSNTSKELSDFNPLSSTPTKQSLGDLNLSASDLDLSQLDQADTEPKPKPKPKTEKKQKSKELPDDLNEAKQYQQALLESNNINEVVLVTDIIKQARKHTKTESLEKHVLTFIDSDTGTQKLIATLQSKNPQLTSSNEKQIKILAGKFGELLTELIFQPYFKKIQLQVHQKLDEGSSFIDIVCYKAHTLMILHDPETLIQKGKDCYIEVKCGQEGYLKSILGHLTSRQIMAHGENHSDLKNKVVSLVVTSKDLRGAKVEAMFRSKVRDAGAKSWALLPAKSELDMVLRTAILNRARQG